MSVRSVVARPAPNRRAVSRALSGDAVAIQRNRKPRARLRTGRCTDLTKSPAPQTPTPTSRDPPGRGSIATPALEGATVRDGTRAGPVAGAPSAVKAGPAAAPAGGSGA